MFSASEKELSNSKQSGLLIYASHLAQKKNLLAFNLHKTLKRQYTHYITI